MLYNFPERPDNEYDMKRDSVVARLAGHLFGDGWLSKGKSLKAGFTADCMGDALCINMI